jgi:hypothetical protein
MVDRVPTNSPLPLGSAVDRVAAAVFLDSNLNCSYPQARIEHEQRQEQERTQRADEHGPADQSVGSQTCPSNHAGRRGESVVK